MKVLIIDDSRTMRRLLASYITSISTTVIEAEDGIHALEQLKLNAPIDLALVDWDMPRMNGLDFIKTVSADGAHAAMKILMVSSHNSKEDVGVALAAGATDFLMKPMTENMVTDKLRLLGMLD